MLLKMNKRKYENKAQQPDDSEAITQKKGATNYVIIKIPFIPMH